MAKNPVRYVTIDRRVDDLLKFVGGRFWETKLCESTGCSIVFSKFHGRKWSDTPMFWNMFIFVG